METLSCKMCGKLFNYTGGIKLCPTCAKEMEDKFQDVKEYIYQHKTATIPEISKEFDVPTQQIQRWIREERLSFSDDSPISMACESCGTNIKTGRYCAECKKRLESGLSNLYQKETPKPQKKSAHDKEKMRFINR